MSDQVIEPSEIIIDAEGTIRDEPIRQNPWVRFVARMFDYSLFCLLLLALRRVFQGSLPFGQLETMIPFEYFVWIPIEATLLAFFGKTPGKWLLGIDLKHGHKSKLDFATALRRSFSVWFRGFAMGIPILNGLCMLVAYNRLKIFQITSWDRDDHIIVTQRRIHKYRFYFASVIAIVGLILYFNSKNKVDYTPYSKATVHGRVI